MASVTQVTPPGILTSTGTLCLPVVGRDLQNEKAWKIALELCRKKLDSAEADVVLQSTNPKDVRKYLEDVRQQQKGSKVLKSIRGINSCIDALTRHEKAIDMFAQAGGMPGCVAWGCTRLVLGLAQGHVKDYERLLKTLSDISEWLEPVGFEATTFVDSPMVIRSLVALHVHIIDFWMKAYIMYSSSRSRRLLGAFRAIWTDFDVEYSSLKGDMNQSLKIFLASAIAEHHRQLDRLDQKFDRMVLHNCQAIEHKDAVRWLAPPDDFSYGVDYYQKTLSALHSARQPGTCEWFLGQEKYLSWKVALPNSQQSFVWLTAIPGAGKSILAAFVISHLLATSQQPTFYFFFDSTSEYTTNEISAGKCLLYQLYMYSRQNGENIHPELQSAMENSGVSKAKSFEAVWDVVIEYARRLNKPVFVIDALDENHEPGSFLRALLALVRETSARLLLTSRPSAVSSPNDARITFMEFAADQMDDIKKYIQHRTKEGMTALPQVRTQIIETLIAKNGGMFLWVRLVLEELESTLSLQEMELALKLLPTDLEGVYANILRNLNETLKQSQREFCRKILTWLFCARRPLTMKELFEAMNLEYAKEGFLYTKETISKAIRAACGPLVVFRLNSLHLVHFSLKEFLIRSPDDWNSSQQELRAFHVNPGMGSLHVLTVCLDSLKNMTSAMTFALWDDESIMDSPDISEMQLKWPLMEYSLSNWMHHAWQSGLDEPATLQTLRTFFESRSSIEWIYIILVMKNNCLEELRWGMQALSLALELESREESISSLHLNDTVMCREWFEFIQEIISDYGNILGDDPTVLFDLDFPSLVQKAAFRPTWISELSRKSCQRQTLRQSFRLRPPETTLTHRRLHIDIAECRSKTYHDERDPAALGLFQVIERYDAFIYASYHLSGKPQLLIQERLTGKRLAPSTCNTDPRIENENSWGSRELVLLDSAISRDETRVAVVYSCSGSTSFFTCVWQLNKAISFDSNLFEAQWGEIIFHNTACQPIFSGSSKLILFADNDLLRCPAGLINVATGSITAFADPILDLSSKNDEAHFGKASRIVFYGEGDTFFLGSQERRGGKLTLQRITSKGEKIDDVLPPDIGGHSYYYCSGVFSTDENGRFIIWTFRRGKSFGLFLHDTADGKYVDLQTSWWFSIDTALFVNTSKTVVIATYDTDTSRLELSTWGISSTSSGLAKITSREYPEELCGMCASADGKILYLVTTNRIVTEFTLPDLEERSDYLGFRGQHLEDIETFPSTDGLKVASIRSDQKRIDIKIWDIQQPSRCLSYYYYRQYSVLRSSQPVFSPNFDWVLFPEDIREAFSLKGEYPIPKDWHIDGNTPQRTNDNAEDSLSEKDLELDHSRAIYLDTDLKGWLDRRDGKMHSSVHFSPCGRYAIGAIDSSPFAAHGIVVWSTGQMHRETHPVDTAELIAFRDAKISVSFDRIRPICYLTYWTKPATRKAICTVHCFVLDLNSATIIKQLESEVLNTKTDYLIPWEDLVSNFQGSETQAWMSQLEMVERSVILSRCGQYLALSASVGPERFHWTVDLTNPQACDSMENEPASSKSPANPGTIEPRFTYWHQHRYWTSVHHQRVLLHCSARSATNPDHFSSLSCHVQLAVLPAYLSDSKTWLLVPESNHDDMTILITNKENPIELWKPKISWDMVVRKLEGVENEHGKAIVALCG